MAKLKIEIDEDSFLKKSVKEQNLDLYKAIVYMNAHGCQWAKGRWKRISIFGVSAGGISGALVNIPGVGKFLGKIIS
jgi:hypothetical protein